MNNNIEPFKKSNIKIEIPVKDNQRVSAWEVYKTLFPGQRRFKEWVENNILNREGFENGKHYFGIDDVSCNSQGKDITYLTTAYKNIELTTDSAKFLAAKSNSKLGDALVWYLIEAENSFKKHLQNGNIRREEHQIPRTYKEALLALVEAEEAKEKLQLTAVNLKTALDDLHDWVSIIKVATLNNVSEKLFNWRELKLNSDQLGYTIKKAASPRYGYQNLYHVNVFKAVYPSFKYDFDESICNVIEIGA